MKIEKILSTGFKFFSRKPPALRELTNPEKRLEIPADFPAISQGFHFDQAESLLKVLERELAKHGTTLKDVKRINIAYPHKHPEIFPAHMNDAESVLKELLPILKEKAGHIEWLPATPICETIYLKRRANQLPIYALTQKHKYAVHTTPESARFPFIEKDNKQKEFFILLDYMSEQGTTLANLGDYIRHNGGIVLAAAVKYTKETVFFAQDKSFFPLDGNKLNLSEKFNDQNRNTGRLAQLAIALASSEENISTPAKCLDLFEDRLNRTGHTVFALTDGECKRIIDSVYRPEKYCDPLRFTKIAAALDEAAADLKLDQKHNHLPRLS